MPTVKISFYDAHASHMRADTLADFLRAPLTGALQEVPGIGKDTESKLVSRGVGTTQQLIGVYLQHQTCNAFFHWLKRVGVCAHRNTIVRCIAEKAALMVSASGRSGENELASITEEDLASSGVQPASPVIQTLPRVLQGRQ